MALSKPRRQRNRHPRPENPQAGVVINRIVAAQAYSLTPTQVQITFQQAWASNTDSDFTGFIRVDTPTEQTSSGIQQNGDASDTLKVLDFGVDIYAGDPCILTIIGQPNPADPGGPFLIGQQFIVEKI